MLSVFLIAGSALALNPISTTAGFGGVADPHVHFFGDRFYLYTTHDFSAEDRGFKNLDWRVFSSPDLLTWLLESTLLPNATPAAPGDYSTCWATDAAAGADGAFYFYLSLGANQIGVMRGATPVGPWEDPLGTPLINRTLGASLHTEARDPCLFVDDDGTPYLIFGTFNYYIARLGADMVSLAEAPRPVAIAAAGGGPATSQNGVGVLDDKPFLHKKGGAYYFSFGGFYGVGAAPYGPFFQRDPTWVDPASIAPDFFLNGTSGPCWCQQVNFNDRHGSFFSAHGQDYWSSNDRSHSADPYNTNAYRDTILTYVHYFGNGSIAPVVINTTGVGSYMAAHGVEAENFFKLRGPGRKVHDIEGHTFAMTGLVAGASALYFPHVRGAGRAARVALRVRAGDGAGVAGARAVLSLGEGGGGPPLCSVALAPLAVAGEGWVELHCEGWGATPTPEDPSVTLTVDGGATGGVSFDRISFL